MQEDNVLLERRFFALTAADKLKVLLDQASFIEFSREKRITSKFFNNRDELTNLNTLKCVQIFLNRTLQNLDKNAEFPDVAVLYALANDEQQFFNRKVQRRIGNFKDSIFLFAGINLVQFATMSGDLDFTRRVFDAVNQNDVFSVTQNLPSGKTYCHIAAVINNPQLLEFWIEQNVDPARPDNNEQTPLDDAKTYKSIAAQNTLLRHFDPAHIDLPVPTSTLEENAMQENKDARVDDTLPPPPPAPDFGAEEAPNLHAAATIEVASLLGLPEDVENIFDEEKPAPARNNAPTPPTPPAPLIPNPHSAVVPPSAPVRRDAGLDDLASRVAELANDNNKAADFVPPAAPARAASPKPVRAASPKRERAASPVDLAPRADPKGKEERDEADNTAERLAARRREEADQPIALSLKRRTPAAAAHGSTGPNFDDTEAVAVGGRVGRPAGDEAVKAQAEGIDIELTKVVSVPFRGKNDPTKPLNNRALSYFEIFKHNEAAGRKLLGILAKLGIKDLITRLSDETLEIPGDDPTRVVVLAGNTSRTTTFHLKQKKGDKQVTRDFGYETAANRIMNRPDIKRNLIDSADRTIMHYAMLSGSFPMVQAVDQKCELLASEELAEKYTINKVDKKGYTAVHYAAMVGNFHDLVVSQETKLRDWIQYDPTQDADVLIKKGRALTLPRLRGIEPLAPAAIISFMNSKGANYGKRSIYGETPLQCAILNNSTRLIPALAEASATALDINNIDTGITGKKTTANMSIVHYAAMHPEVSAETLTVIIEKCYLQPVTAEDVDPVYGCVNAQDVDGNTPLHYAAATGNLHAMLVLMSHGADANLVNHAGKTPLQVASRVFAKAKNNEAFTLTFSTDVPGVQNVMGRFGPNAGHQRILTQKEINEFKEFVTHEILNGRLFNKVTKKLDEIFPLWYELVGPEAAPQSEAEVKPGKIYLLEDGFYMLRTPVNVVIQERFPAHLGVNPDNYAAVRKSVRFKQELLDHTTSQGQTKPEPTNTLEKQVACYVDAALMLLVMGGATPTLDRNAPLHAKKIVECELELKRVTDPNFTKTFDASKKAAYSGLITNGTKSTAKEFTVPDLPNDAAVASSQMLLRNYYSRGFKNNYLDRFFAFVAHPGRGHHESVKEYQRRLEAAPGDKEAQLEAGNEALYKIAKDIRNNPFPHRRAQGSSALSRVAVSRELIDRSYTNGHKADEVPDLEKADADAKGETFDKFDVEPFVPK